ncbi:MAG: leucine-rich repeat protein [Clostridia bacterium]|nr:leucine-rich repeat protein [Clostridia bacterium]
MKMFKKILATVLCVIMVFGSAPLSGLVGLDLPEFNLFTPKASAATYSGTCGDNLTWTLDTNTGRLIINGSGEMYDWISGSSVPWYSYRSYIEKVRISNSVTSIGEYAFYDCSGLTSITIPDSVTSIGKYAFYYCSGLSRITIPDGVTSIGVSAFYGCTKLTSITIPDGVTSIGGSAFWDCYGLTSITIPDSVTSIGGSAFYGCTKLTSITIPDSVTSIGYRAFFRCTGLTRITIGSGVTSIGERAFYGCTGLTSITIPDSVTSIGYLAFSNCDSLEKIYYAGTPEQWEAISVGENNDSLPNIIIFECNSERPYYQKGRCGENLEWILYADGELVINGTGGMKDWSSKTSTPWYKWISQIKSVSVDNGVTSIGKYAFDGCTDLTSITIPDSVTSIGESAFYGCTGLKDVYYNGSGRDWEKIEIRSNNSLLSQATKHYTYYYITWITASEAIEEKVKVGDRIILPAEPQKEGYSFVGWDKVVPETMPANNLEFVAEWSINSHTVTWIVDGNETVDTYNYGDTIVKPADPEKVGYTFTDWGAEISTTVPDEDLVFTATWQAKEYNVTWNVDGEISTDTYYFDDAITAPTPEKDGYFFIGWDKVVPDTMPAESLEFVAQWSKVEYEFEFDGNGIIITAAKDASGDIEIPAIINGYPVIAIDECAFAGSDITSVTIFEGVESIGLFAFAYCDKLETVNIPSSVTEIDYGAFSGCSNIETINISADNNNFVTDEYGVVYTEGFIELVYAPAKSVGEAYAMRSTATYIYPFAFSDCSDFALTISDNLSDEDADEFLLYISVNEFITNDSCINFKAVDGVLYNKAVTKLYKYPVDNKREFYALPSSVTTIADATAFVCVDTAFYLFVDEDIIIAGVDEIFKTPENLTLHIDYASEFTVDHFTMTLLGPAHVCVGDITKADADALNENAEEIIAEQEEIWDEIEPELTPGTDEYDFMKAYVLGYIDMITNYVDCENNHTRLHKYAAVVEKDEGNCTNDGCTNYKCVCGYEFTEAITAPGHNYVAVVTAPTCTKEGYTTHTCSACGDTYVNDEVVKLGHNYDTVVTDPTCTKEGYTTYTCSACGDTYVNDEVSATGHSHESKVTKEPTCTTTGIKTFTCHCGDSYTEIIKANGHTKGEWEYIGGKEYAKNCTVCGDKLESKIVTVNMMINGENVNKTQILNKSTATVVATVTDNFTNNLVFASSDDSIVSIDANGNIIANDVGKATVTVTISGTAISDSIEVEVLPRDFTITWNVNGKVTKQTIKEYASITPNIDTKRPGYKFVGWDSEVPSTMPAKNLSFTAKFELSFKMSIRKPSTTTISYGDSIILHADMNEALPSGWTVKWTADNGNFSYSANGETCTITPSKSGDTTFTATVYDENGNEISKDTQTMKSKAGFFDKFAAFFRKLFGMTKIIQQSINF